MLMDDDPNRTRHMLADLEAVKAEFPDPPGAHEPLHVPSSVAARWQLAIAREAEGRACGYHTDTSPGRDSSDRAGDGPDEGG